MVLKENRFGVWLNGGLDKSTVYTEPNFLAGACNKSGGSC